MVQGSGVQVFLGKKALGKGCRLRVGSKSSRFCFADMFFIKITDL